MDQEKVTNLQQRQEEEEEESQEDAISLCDLSIDNYQEDSDSCDNGGNSDQFDRTSEEDNFEFSFTNPVIIADQNDAGLVNSDDDIINAINFCGKIIGYNNNNAKNSKQQGEAGENQTRRLKKSASSQSPSQLASGSYRYRSSSKSSSSRYKPKVLIGMVKIPTEMDLSDIKKRQSKMRNQTTTASPKFPVTSAAQPAAAGGENGSAADGGGSERRHGKNRWGIVRSLTCGTRLANVFAKTAFGCFSFSVLRVAD